MMRSMWSGVSGLKSHQEAMDVVGNNVANVNTIGFKKGRINFVDVLSQTIDGAAGPEDNRGGKNPHQVGLGDTVATVDNIFSQGSLQSTDKVTDLAIQGDGFFVVSNDGGKTYRYTRAGDFNFDADGNLTNAQGYIVQGWLANDETHRVDTTSTIKNLVIPQDKTVPAGVTSNVSIKANLNGGETIKEMTTARDDGVDEYGDTIHSDDVGVLFNSKGEALNIGRSGDQAVFAAGGSSSTSISGAYNVDDNQIVFPNGSTLSITVTQGSTDYTHTFTATGSSTFQDLVDDLNTWASSWGATNPFGINSNGEIVLDNNSGSSITVSSIKTNGDLNGYLKEGLLNLQGGEGSSATIAAGDSRTSMPFLAHKGDVLALSYDEGANYNAYIYTTSDTASGNDKFTTLHDLADEINNDISGWGTASINSEKGTIEIKNTSSSDYTLGAARSNNDKFENILGTLSGTVAAGGGILSSQPFMAAVHSTSIDVYDTLGDKHTITFTYRKAKSEMINNQPQTTWDWSVAAPSPSEITNATGSVKFDNTGKLIDFSSPHAITIDWKNGTTPQLINLDFGQVGTFDGLSQIAEPSQTISQSQDGYAGGSLQRILITQEGVIEGIFSNGKTYALGQVSLAKFSNNMGLMKEGDSMYSETSNSGAPAVGTAETGGRGRFAPSHLEMSNVDLAEEFTNMIIFERGFQANSRSITTSDQMIQELLNLKR
jgi:flagellar hook protein FlgE